MRRSTIVAAILISLQIPISFAEEQLEEPILDDRYMSLETLAKGLFYLESLYVDKGKVTQDQLVTNALQGIVSNLDPHTVLMPAKVFEQLTIDTQGKFGGIGIIVTSKDNKLIVISPIEDTPAYKAGIKSGDEIIAIDGVDVSTMDDTAASDKMRGDPDTKIKLTIRRKGLEKPMDFELVREIVKVHSVKSQALGEEILYARISSFQDNTTEELKAALSKNPGIKGLILDLRDNPGGLLDQAVQVSDLFIESGIIVSTVGRDPQNIEREFAHKRGTFAGFPIIVLINEGSASASEIVAGALQDHERALILGTQSFGKGSVQTLVSLPDNSGLKITVARYYTPKDRSIQARGIKPDVYVEPTLVPKASTQRKESDLKGHIESKDLSDMARTSGILDAIKKWPEQFKGDNQLITAYTYVRGWNVFNRGGLKK
ncbi:MAG: S41 family peptidase [Oligoflexales bacterium]